MTLFVSATSWTVSPATGSWGTFAVYLKFEEVTSFAKVTVERGGPAGCDTPDWKLERILTVTRKGAKKDVPMRNLTVFTHYRLMDGNTQKLRGYTAPS